VLTESELLTRARASEAGALAELYQRFAPAIYAYIYRRVGEVRLAEDLTGDVFVQALSTLRTERFARTSLAAWLYRIAHNRVIDHYRRERQALVPLEEWMPASEDVPEAAARRSTQEWMRQALRHLSEDQQQVLVLRFGQAMSAAEAAQVLGKTEEAVRALQHRALAALRRLMEEGAP
jgi:RNA polymerase sigma-70 factor (ECF subfamily)